MDVQVEELSSVQKKLTFTVPSETVDEELTTAFKTLRKEVVLPGFRPGKVPRKLLDQRFGKEIRAEVSTKLISDAFDKAMEDHDLEPVSTPDIDQGELRGGQAYTFSVTIDVKPTVTIEDYSGVKVYWDKPEVADAEVDEQIESMRSQSGSLVVVGEDRPVADGDVADVSFTLSADGNDDLVREHLMVSVPEDHYHGWLVDLVRGAAKGEIREGEVTVPGDYIEPAWAGKPAAVKLEVHEIKTVQYPDLDDEFAKDMGHDTLDAMKTAIRFRIQEAKDKRARDEAARRVITKVLAANEFEVSARQVEARGQSLVQSIASQMMPGMDQAMQFSLDDMDDERKASVLQEAEFAVRREILLDAIVAQEELTVSDEEKDARIQQMAEETGQRPETIRGYLMKAGGLEELEGSMKQDKAIDLLLERAELLDEPEPEPAAEPAAEPEAAEPEAAEPEAAEPEAAEPEAASSEPAAADAEQAEEPEPENEGE